MIIRKLLLGPPGLRTELTLGPGLQAASIEPPALNALPFDDGLLRESDHVTAICGDSVARAEATPDRWIAVTASAGFDREPREILPYLERRLRALADTRGLAGTSEEALARLDMHIRQTGHSPAQGHVRSPFDRTHARLAEVEQERAHALVARAEAGQLMIKRRQAQTTLRKLRRRHRDLEEERRDAERAALGKRLRAAEPIADRLNTLTQKCFALNRFREFPLERKAAVERAAVAAGNVRTQIEETEKRLRELEQQLGYEIERLGAMAFERLETIPEVPADRVLEAESQLAETRSLLEACERDAEKGQALLKGLRTKLAALPDFGQMGPDPVEWLSQLAASFRLQIRARDAEQATLGQIRERLAREEAEGAPQAPVFEAFTDFRGELEAYETRARSLRDQIFGLKRTSEHLQRRLQEYEESIPGLRFMTLFIGALGGLFAGAAHFSANPFVYLPAGICAIAVLYFAASWIYACAAARRARAGIEEATGDLTELQAAGQERRASIESAIEQAGCKNVRELEAAYDRFCETRTRIETARKELEQQETLYEEERDHCSRLLARLRRTFSVLDIEIESEDTVETAAQNAIQRYQEYRDTKRTANEWVHRLDNLEREQKQLAGQIARMEQDTVACAIELRRVLREAGFADEANHAGAGDALRAYRIRYSQFRHKWARVEQIEQAIGELDAMLQTDRDKLKHEEHVVAAALEEGGARSLDQWRESVLQAEEYRRLRAERSRVREEIDRLLGGGELDAIRREFEAQGSLVRFTARSPEEVETDERETASAIEEQTREERRLQDEIHKRLEAGRPLNEIEEEYACLLHRIEQYSLEQKAASYAAAIVEESTREARAQIAAALEPYANHVLGAMMPEIPWRLRIEPSLAIHLEDTGQQEIARSEAEPDATITLRAALAAGIALAGSIQCDGEPLPLLMPGKAIESLPSGELARLVALLQTESPVPQTLILTENPELIGQLSEAGVRIVETATP